MGSGRGLTRTHFSELKILRLESVGKRKSYRTLQARGQQDANGGSIVDGRNSKEEQVEAPEDRRKTSDTPMEVIVFDHYVVWGEG